MSDRHVVLITGAASGMGAQHARAAAAAGWYVCVADVADTSPVAAEIRRASGSCSQFSLDVADPEAWAETVRTIRDSLGRLDGLVNNAGVSQPRADIIDATHDDWRRILGINLDGPFYGMQTCAPVIRDSGGGSIVNISSIAGQVGYYSAAYSASKWGLRGLSKSAAGALADWGIRVNSVHPGLIETPLVSGATDFIESSIKSIPLGRVGDADEVSRAVLFLLSPESSYITGAEITVDGGLTSVGLYQRILSDAKKEI